MKKHITPFYIETLVLVLVFVAVILTLTQVFGMAKKQSEEAKLLTAAVTLAQNAAEAFSVSENDEKLLTLLDEGGNANLNSADGAVEAFYGADMKPDRGGVLRVRVERNAVSPFFSEGAIRVFRADTGGEIYSVETAATYAEEEGS